MVFGVFSPGRTQCIAPKKLPDKAMSIWNLHKKFQLSSAMGLRDFDLQSQPTLMGGNPLIVVHWTHGTGVDGLLHLLYNRLYGNLGVKINFIAYLKFLYFRGWLYHDMKTESFVENSS